MMFEILKQYEVNKLTNLFFLAFASFTGMWVGSVFAPWVIAFAGAGFIASAFIKIGFSLAGVFLGAGAYTQFLKEFELWPMQIKSKSIPNAYLSSPEPNVSFRPRNLLRDIIQLLRKFDRELLKAIFKTTGENFYIGKEVAEDDTSPLAQFVRLLDNDGCYKGSLKPHREYFNRLHGHMRLCHFDQINKDYLEGIRSSKKVNPERSIKVLQKAELAQYNSFLRTLNKKGIIEGTLLALENENKNPPKALN